MKELKKSILFWTVIVCAVFLAATFVLSLCGLKFRVWIREPVTLAIAFGAVIGLLQLVLKIHKKAVKIITILLWAAAAGAFGFWGFIQFAFSTRTEEPGTVRYQGKECLVERENVIWVDYHRYYEYHGPFVCGKDWLYSDDPLENPQSGRKEWLET